MGNKEYVIVQSNEQLQKMMEYLKKEKYSFLFEDSLSIADKDLILIIDPQNSQVTCEDAGKIFENADIPVISIQRFFSKEFDKLLNEHDYSFGQMQENQSIEGELMQDPSLIAM